MLKKQVMAKKVAKFMLAEVVKDSGDSNLKESVINGLEKAYLAGYDFAVELCTEDNSKAGFEMAEHLSAIQEDGSYYAHE